MRGCRGVQRGIWPGETFPEEVMTAQGRTGRRPRQCWGQGLERRETQDPRARGERGRVEGRGQAPLPGGALEAEGRTLDSSSRPLTYLTACR